MMTKVRNLFYLSAALILGILFSFELAIASGSANGQKKTLVSQCHQTFAMAHSYCESKLPQKDTLFADFERRESCESLKTRCAVSCGEASIELAGGESTVEQAYHYCEGTKSVAGL